MSDMSENKEREGALILHVRATRHSPQIREDVVAMWNGDNNQESSSEVIDPATLLKMVTEARDQYKAEAERFERVYKRITERYDAAAAQLSTMLDNLDSEPTDEITFDSQDVEKLADHLGVTVTTERTFDVTLTGTISVELPRWMNPRDLDSYSIQLDITGSLDSGEDVSVDVDIQELDYRSDY